MPVSDVTNLQRAIWAEAAIRCFRSQTGCDHEDALGDLLCNLMHWANYERLDFGAALDRAEDHYQAELAET